MRNMKQISWKSRKQILELHRSPTLSNAASSVQYKILYFVVSERKVHCFDFFSSRANRTLLRAFLPLFGSFGYNLHLRFSLLIPLNQDDLPIFNDFPGCSFLRIRVDNGDSSKEDGKQQRRDTSFQRQKCWVDYRCPESICPAKNGSYIRSRRTWDRI